MAIDTASAKSAVTLEEAKAHLRVDDESEDALIAALCLACTQMAEHELQRPLITREGSEGFGDSPSDVPQGIRQWILLHVGHYFEHREAATPTNYQALPYLGALLDPWRVWS